MARDYGKYLARGSTIVFLSLILGAVFGFLLRIFLARSLSTAEYGLFFAVFEFISFFGFLKHLGMNASLTKFLPEFRTKNLRRRINSSIVTALVFETVFTVAIVSILVTLSGWLASSYFNSPKAVSIIVFVSGVFFAMMFVNVFSSVFSGFRDMLGRQLGNLFQMGFTLAIVAITTVFLTPSLYNISAGYLFGAVLAALLSFVFLRRRHPISLFEGSFDMRLGRRLLKFGLPLVLAGVAGTIMGHMDTMMITAFRSLETVGYYQVASPAARTLGFIGGALSAPVLPMISELWSSEERQRLRNILSTLFKLSFLIVIPASMVFIAFPEVVIRILFTSQYLAGRNALRILGVGMIFKVVGASFGPTLTGTGNPTKVLWASGTGAVLNVLANLVLVPRHGAGGAALATSLSFLISTLMAFYFVRKITKFSPRIRPILKTLAGGGVMLLIVTVLKTVLSINPVVELFVVMIPSLAVYLVWICQTGAITKHNLDLLERTTPLPSNIVEVLRKITRK